MINRIKKIEEEEGWIDPNEILKQAMNQYKADIFKPYLNTKPPTKLSMSPDLTKMTNNDQNSFNWNDFDYAGAGKIVEAVGGIGKYIAENVKTKRPPLAYTIGLYGNGGNLFDIGGKIGAGIQGLTSIAGSFVDGYTTEDINPTLDELHNRSIDQSYAQNFNDLADEYSQYRAFNTVDARDVRDKTWAEDGMNILGSIGSGATAGATIGGPWGALAGAIVGLAGSTTGVLLGRAKADKKADKLNKQRRLANEARLNTLGYRAETLSNKNYLNDMRNLTALGGPLNTNGGLWDNGLIYINNGGTHEQSPYEGVPMGVDQQGIPNLVEEGEIIWNDYVFSDRINVPKELRNKYKLGGDLSFAKAINKLSKESKEKPNDPFMNITMPRIYEEFKNIQEEERMKIQNKKMQKLFSQLSPEELAMLEQLQYENNQVPVEQEIPETELQGNSIMACGGRKYDLGSVLRFAPAVGSALSLMQPDGRDYTNADAIAGYANSLQPVSYSEIPYQLQPKYFNTTNSSNLLAGETANVIRAITENTSNPAAAIAGIAAIDAKYKEAQGDLAMKAQKENWNMLKEVAAHKAAIDAQNVDLKAKQAAQNFEIQNRIADYKTKAALLREEIDSSYYTSRSNNFNNLFSNLGKIGEDMVNKKDVRLVTDSGVGGILNVALLQYLGYSPQQIQEIIQNRKSSTKIKQDEDSDEIVIPERPMTYVENGKRKPAKKRKSSTESNNDND